MFLFLSLPQEYPYYYYYSSTSIHCRITRIKVINLEAQFDIVESLDQVDCILALHDHPLPQNLIEKRYLCSLGFKTILAKSVIFFFKTTSL